MKTLELHPAGRWVCDDCCQEHFITLMETSDEPPEPGLVGLRIPTHVTCTKCGTTFEVEYDDSDDPEITIDTTAASDAIDGLQIDLLKAAAAFIDLADQLLPQAGGGLPGLAANRQAVWDRAVARFGEETLRKMIFVVSRGQPGPPEGGS